MSVCADITEQCSILVCDKHTSGGRKINGGVYGSGGGLKKPLVALTIRL